MQSLASHRHRFKISRRAGKHFSQTTHPGLPIIEGRIGNLEVHLASKMTDVLKGMRLRYEVFYEEKSAKPNALGTLLRLDHDSYDRICDHLLVFDMTPPKKGIYSQRSVHAVATYRILRDEVAQRSLGFYSQREFNLEPLLKSKSSRTRFMELGRSCVKKHYRTKRCIELLWQGLWQYAKNYQIDVMVGCASFEGTNITQHAQALSYLSHFASCPKEWYCKAHDNLYQPMNLLPKEKIDVAQALKQMPPLIKGYLRLGAFVGDGAVIDPAFGTTDVLIVLPVERIHPRYFAYFGTSAEEKLTKEAA